MELVNICDGECAISGWGCFPGGEFLFLCGNLDSTISERGDGGAEGSLITSLHQFV